MAQPCVKLDAAAEHEEPPPGDEVNSEASGGGGESGSHPAASGGASEGCSCGSVSVAQQRAAREREESAWRKLKESWCRVESMPQESWLRRRRKHWPDQSRSTVFCELAGLLREGAEDGPRCDWKSNRKEHPERRHHFPSRSNAPLR